MFCDLPCKITTAMMVVSAAFMWLQLTQHSIARVYTRPGLLSPAECEHAVRVAEEANAWTERRHPLYPTDDVPVKDVSGLANISRALDDRLLPLLREVFSVRDDLDVRVDDLFLIRYKADRQSGLKMHTDATTLSFSVALSDPESYTGGGISFDLLDAPLRVEQGTAVMHPSGLQHMGAAVQSGTRYVLVGFVSVGDDNFFTLGRSEPGSPELLHGIWATCVQAAIVEGDTSLNRITGKRLQTSVMEERCIGKWEAVARLLAIKAGALREGVANIAAGGEMSDDAKQLLILNGAMLLGSIVFLMMA